MFIRCTIFNQQVKTNLITRIYFDFAGRSISQTLTLGSPFIARQLNSSKPNDMYNFRLRSEEASSNTGKFSWSALEVISSSILDPNLWP